MYFYVLVYPQGRYKWSLKQSKWYFWKLSAYIARNGGLISSQLKNYGFSEKNLSRDLKLPRPPKINRVSTNRLILGCGIILVFKIFYIFWENTPKTPKIGYFQYIFKIGIYRKNKKIWVLWLILYGFDLYRPPKVIKCKIRWINFFPKILIFWLRETKNGTISEYCPKGEEYYGKSK